MTSSPTPPIELAGHGSHFAGDGIELPDDLIDTIAAICEVVTDDEGRLAESSRDWWPLALHWSIAGEVPQMADLLARPATTQQVAALARACSIARVPLTVAGGRSGVCGAAVPIFGGVVLDTTALAGVCSVDEVSGVVEVLAGTFGPDLEAMLQSRHGLSVGHFPQSFDIATVGGWVACPRRRPILDPLRQDRRHRGRARGGAGRRHGRAHGRRAARRGRARPHPAVHRSGGHPRRDHPRLVARAPRACRRAAGAWWFPTFGTGLDACRRILQGGATPAVLRLYDADEAARSHGGDGRRSLLLVLDESDPLIIGATFGVVDRECTAAGGVAADVALVAEWLEHRNDTSALQALVRKGFVVDTMEIAGRWKVLPDVFEAARVAILAVPHALVATCHASHSYLDGACLYFTFAAAPPPAEVDTTYRRLWDAGTRAVLDAGGNLSHHHGVGLNRARFVAARSGQGTRCCGR